MLEYLELIAVMAAVGVPFYLYISISRYFHIKTERTARVMQSAMVEQEEDINSLAHEIQQLRSQIRALEAKGNDSSFASVHKMASAKTA
ncbi:MAG: hypothetical protein R3332_12770 [Pseudohongiellaceae bacterium]|nr:hypothetical protein [Pseudohongiellaceae bacterium]